MEITQKRALTGIIYSYLPLWNFFCTLQFWRIVLKALVVKYRFYHLYKQLGKKDNINSTILSPTPYLFG